MAYGINVASTRYDRGKNRVINTINAISGPEITNNARRRVYFITLLT